MFLCPVARSGCPPAPVPGLRVAFVGSGSAPAHLPGPGKVGSYQDRTPGAHTGGCGETLLSGEEASSRVCVCVGVHSSVYPRPVLQVTCEERLWIFTEQSSSRLCCGVV